MKKLLLAALVLFWTGSAWAGHDDDLSAAANRLHNAAHYFYEKLHYAAPYHPGTKKAQALAYAAKVFSRKVKYARSVHYLWRDYQHLAKRYHRLYKEVHYARAGHRRLGHGFRRVADAFDAVDYAMNARRRYAYDYHDENYDRHSDRKHWHRGHGRHGRHFHRGG